MLFPATDSYEASFKIAVMTINPITIKHHRTHLNSRVNLTCFYHMLLDKGIFFLVVNFYNDPIEVLALFLLQKGRIRDDSFFSLSLIFYDRGLWFLFCSLHCCVCVVDVEETNNNWFISNFLCMNHHFFCHNFHSFLLKIKKSLKISPNG